MTKTIGRIAREGKISFGDASLSVWEDSLPSLNCTDAHKKRDAWEAAFKKQVFARIIQQLNRLGWTCTKPPIDPHSVKHYGGNVARWASERHRNCSKGDLKGELSVSGRSIDFKMWQDVTPSENPNGGQYDFNKEKRMPYVIRLEMERTRRRIREYLCNVFTGYEFEPDRYPPMGLMGLTAEQKAAHDRRTSGHYKPALDRAEISMPSNAIAADGGTIEHGARVWALDSKGRIITGTAYYSLNNAWQIVTGRYGLTRCFTSEIFTKPPEQLRDRFGKLTLKRNKSERRKRLEHLMQDAVTSMDFDRAKVLKAILFPSGPLYAIWSKKNNCYFSVMYCGYSNSLESAGKYTRAELKPYLGDELETNQYKAVLVTN